MFVGGIYAYPFFVSEDSQIQHEPINFGGYVVVQVYDSDGKLKQTWEGHNSLTPVFIHHVSSCVTGMTSISFGGNCNTDLVQSVFLSARNPSTVQISEPATNTLIPTGCSNSGTNICTGWETVSLHDSLSSNFLCSEPVGDPCPAIFQISTNVNSIPVDILYKKGDRIATTIAFSFT